MFMIFKKKQYENQVNHNYFYCNVALTPERAAKVQIPLPPFYRYPGYTVTHPVSQYLLFWK